VALEEMRVQPEMLEPLEAQVQEVVEGRAALQGLVGAVELVEVQEVQGLLNLFLMGLLGLEEAVAVAQEPPMMAPLRAAQFRQAHNLYHPEMFLQLEAVGGIPLTTTCQLLETVLKLRFVFV
jgi:hypothetical protein